MKRKGTDLVVSSLYVALGVAFAMMGTLALKCGYVILGGILSFFGIINLSKRKRGGGLLYLVMGVALTLCAFTPLFRYLVVAFGMLTVVNGLVCIFQIIRSNKRLGADIISALLTVIVGFLLLFAYGEQREVFIRIGGILLVVNGTLKLLVKGFLRK